MSNEGRLDTNDAKKVIRKMAEVRQFVLNVAVLPYAFPIVSLTNCDTPVIPVGFTKLYSHSL